MKVTLIYMACLAFWGCFVFFQAYIDYYFKLGNVFIHTPSHLKGRSVCVHACARTCVHACTHMPGLVWPTGIPMTASSKAVSSNLLREQSDSAGPAQLLCMLSTKQISLEGGGKNWRIHLLISATLRWCKITLIWLLVRTG